ncbi:kinase-like domain-containing protein [Gigaspora rosea]|uniref:Kinase-like domain-containing protein n=1 Tax=Gigaspora rosea TaxID=44941 RepID=A0A397VCL0_9GLOM|nr:kinase-like domain-containing protein [Gigaspora rosea]
MGEKIGIINLYRIRSSTNDIIHCDLHSGNIFQDNLHSVYIGDLGISISVNKTSDKVSKGIYGALPYISPEVLQGKPFTKASDIYSFGMIMWEISSGKLVFSDYKNNDSSLAIEICFKELRPNILKGTATCYANLLKKCWDEDPEKRPSALEIHEIISKWKNSTETLSEFLKSDKEMVIEIKELTPNILKNLLREDWEKDPEQALEFHNSTEFLTEFLKSNKEMVIENNDFTRNNIEDTINFISNINQALTEFLKSDKEIVIENNGFNNIEDSTIYTSNFISYVNQQSLEHIAANDTTVFLLILFLLKILKM